MPERKPQPNGVLDNRLGISNKTTICPTCGNKLADCAGHFGYVKLEMPVFHIGYFKNTIQLLQCLCKCCGRVLLTEEERLQFMRRFRNPKLERLQRMATFKRVLDTCKKSKVCFYCGETNGVVKKVPGALKVQHDRYGKSPDQLEEKKAKMELAAMHNEALRPLQKTLVEILDPIKTLELFRKVRSTTNFCRESVLALIRFRWIYTPNGAR